MEDSYVAYCFDQATNYFGATVDSELAKLDEPRGKGSAKLKAQAAQRQKKLDELLGIKQEKKAQYADPAQFFK